MYHFLRLFGERIVTLILLEIGNKFFFFGTRHMKCKSKSSTQSANTGASKRNVKKNIVSGANAGTPDGTTRRAKRKKTLHRVLSLWWNNHLKIRRDDDKFSLFGRACIWWTRLPTNCLRATSSFRTAGFSLNFVIHFSTLVLFLSGARFLVLLV